MEYASSVWDPPLQTQVTALEQVQRRAAHYVCNDFTSRMPRYVTKMLDELNWEPHEVRHRHELLSMLYRIQPCECTHYQRTSQVFPGRNNRYCVFFFPRTVWDWNRLSAEVVSAASLEEFRSLLDVNSALQEQTGQQY